MELHDKNSTNENRLIILFFYHKMGMPLPDSAAEEYIGQHQWMSYFDMKEHMIDLLSEGYLEEVDHKKRITAKAIYILDNFKQDIPFSIRDSIDHHARENRVNLQRDMEIYANYSQDSSSEFPVVLKLFDNNNEVLNLRVTAASAEDAEKLCNIFRTESAEIYADIISRVISKL